MKNVFILFVSLSISFNSNAQVIDTMEVVYDSIRPLTELNSEDGGEGYPWISNDGLRIYFAKGSGFGDVKIYYSQREGIHDLFSDPVILPLDIEFNHYTSPWLTKDELNLFFFDAGSGGSDGQDTELYYASREDISEDFDAPSNIKLLGGVEGFFFGSSFTSDMEQMFIYNSSDSGSIFIMEKTGDLEYTKIDEIKLPEGYDAYPGQLSSDGLTYYFSITPQTELKPLLYVTRRPNLDSKFTTFYYLDNPDINTTDFLGILPSTTDNEQFLVFTKNGNGTWYGNDLYIAYNENPLSTEKLAKTNVLPIHVSPNPASDFVRFDLSNTECSSSDLEIIVFTSEGKLYQLLDKNPLNSEVSIETNNYNSGLYFFNVRCENEIVGSGRFIIEK